MEQRREETTMVIPYVLNECGALFSKVKYALLKGHERRGGKERREGSRGPEMTLELKEKAVQRREIPLQKDE